MGIPGLTAYVSRDDGSFVSHCLHNTYLVVDAENFMNARYQESGLATQYGGEYLAFATNLRTFLALLARCCVTPIFVFEGVHSQDGSKRDKLISRSSESIQQVSQYLVALSRNRRNLPIDIPRIQPAVVTQVLLNILQETQVPYVVWEREAVKSIAELAVYVGCPVLTKASDFFLFYTHEPKNYRVIPLSSLDTKNVTHITNCHICHRTSVNCYGLKCKVFNRATSNLKCVTPKLLRLLPLLTGYDSVTPVDAPHGFQQLLNRITWNLSYSSKIIQDAVDWLSEFGEDMAKPVNEILSQYSTTQRPTVMKKIAKVLMDYTLDARATGTEMTRVLSLTTKIQGTQLSTNTASSDMALLEAVFPSLNLRSPQATSTTSFCSGWPASLVNLFHTGEFSRFTLDALYVKNGLMLKTAFEDVYRIRSVHQAGEPIRRLQCSLLIELERSLGRLDKLCGLTWTKWNETRREGAEMDQIELSAIPLTYRTDPSIVNVFSAHLGLVIPMTEEGERSLRFLACVLTLWFRRSDRARRSADSFAKSTVGLAFAACVLVTHAHLEDTLGMNKLTGLDTRRELIEKHYTGCCETEERNKPLSYNIKTVHQLNELQLVYRELKQLVALLRELHAHYQAPGGRADTATPAPDEVFEKPWSEWIVFASCRLMHCVAQSLQSVPMSQRVQNIRSTWIPRLIDAPSLTTRRQLEGIQDRFCTLVSLVE